MPHPPLVIPAIGHSGINEVKATVKGMQAAACELVNSKPETIVFLTPHGNVFYDCITFLSEPELQGDFSLFGYQEIVATCNNDLELIGKIKKKADETGIQLYGIDHAIAVENGLNPKLDHGILVPLHYLREAGLDDQVSITAISVGNLAVEDLYYFGSLIEQAALELNRKTAIVASGDMSHRLKDEGPYDYHPDGPVFDHTIREYLSRGDVLSLLDIEDSLLENAGQCGYRSVVIMLGALDGKLIVPKIFSYEGPFGVGYLTAGFKLGQPVPGILPKIKEKQELEKTNRQRNESIPVKWARITLESYLKNMELPHTIPGMDNLFTDRAGVFVSLKKKGQLRGCIGTIRPVYDNLAQEIAANVISAGLKDPRFLPVTVGELDDLVYSVDILSKPEQCSKKDLDPREYGVIVTQGNRTGLLLPDIQGVDTVEKQLEIALQKAGIKNGEYTIERFKVVRYT